MASKNKTKETAADVMEFLNSFVESDEKKKDSLQLIEWMSKWSKSEPKIWGASIIGFGSYHYKYASGHEGDAPIIGFSPRKAQFSLYAYAQGNEYTKGLEQLGKYKMGKACIYFKKLEDINPKALEMLCKSTIQFLKETYDCS